MDNIHICMDMFANMITKMYTNIFTTPGEEL